MRPRVGGKTASGGGAAEGEEDGTTRRTGGTRGKAPGHGRFEGDRRGHSEPSRHGLYDEGPRGSILARSDCHRLTSAPMAHRRSLILDLVFEPYSPLLPPVPPVLLVANL